MSVRFYLLFANIASQFPPCWWNVLDTIYWFQEYCVGKYDLRYPYSTDYVTPSSIICLRPHQANINFTLHWHGWHTIINFSGNEVQLSYICKWQFHRIKFPVTKAIKRQDFITQKVWNRWSSSALQINSALKLYAGKEELSVHSPKCQFRHPYWDTNWLHKRSHLEI